jgi:hypothetical protein
MRWFFACKTPRLGAPDWQRQTPRHAGCGAANQADSSSAPYCSRQHDLLLQRSNQVSADRNGRVHQRTSACRKSCSSSDFTSHLHSERLSWREWATASHVCFVYSYIPDDWALLSRRRNLVRLVVVVGVFADNPSGGIELLLELLLRGNIHT